MSVDRAAAAFLLLLPAGFNACFLLLARRFDYPGILRSPTGDILARFQAGGTGLKILWFAFMLTAVLLAPLAVLLGQVLARDGPAIAPTAAVVGILAAVVQFLGLARWPFLVPALARTYTDPTTDPVRREATAVVFQAFHRYLGVGVGESLGYLLTGGWTVLVGVAMLGAESFGPWLAWPAIAIGSLLIVCSVESVGRFEEHGWKLAGAIIPVAYIAWSVWLIASGVVLLLR